LGNALEQTIPQEIVNSINNGLGNGYLTDKPSITSVLRQFAGPSGNATIKQSLMPNSTGTPAEILLHSCASMNYWAGLYTADFQGKLLEGVKTLLACAHKVLAQQAGGRPASLMLPAPEDH